jgi:hypothetical protein
VSDVNSERGDALEQEREMREHERQAQEHEPAERGPDAAAGDGDPVIDPESRTADPAGPDQEREDRGSDESAGKPGPPGNLDLGGGVSGGH